jgi:hypothetical protein
MRYDSPSPILRHRVEEDQAALDRRFLKRYDRPSAGICH